MSELKANFKIEKREPIQATFRISLTPKKVSQLENDLDFVRREEVNLPDVDFDKFATKDEVENLSEQKVDVSDFESAIEDINVALDEKQPKGDYTTQLEVMQMIASIPQFKTETVLELPLVGEKMTLYLVPKNGQENDIYNEYVWIEETQSFEFLGTMALDLSNYLTPEKLGINKVVPMSSEDEYEKLETKEANTLYLIEE